MPIPVVCDSCQTRLNAPDAAAGRKVKCPKCQAVMPVPGAAPAAPPPPSGDAGSPFSFDDNPPATARQPASPPPPPPPAAGGGSFDFGAAVSAGGGKTGGGKPRRDDDPPPRRSRGDDDYEADDDSPRGRRGSAGGGSKSPALTILLVGGGLLLTCCGGGAFGVYYVYTKAKEKVVEVVDRVKAENEAAQKRIEEEKKKQAAAKTPPPGWKAFAAADGSFKGYFPDEPMVSDEVPPLAPPAGKKGIAPAPGKGYVSGSGEMIVMATVYTFPAAYPAAEREKALDRAIRLGGTPKGAKLDVKDADWLGQKAKELTTRVTGEDAVNVVRYVVVGNTGYVGMIQYKGARREELEKGFFDAFEPLAK